MNIDWHVYGNNLRAITRAIKDEYLDDDDNLFCVYIIEDEPHLVAPMVALAIVGKIGSRLQA